VIHGLDGPVVVLEARVAAMLARPLERLVADARRRGEVIDPAVLAAVADCERVRRVLVTLAEVPQSVPQAEPPEPPDGGEGVQQPHDLGTEDAAALLGVSPSYLRRQARRRRLGRKVGSGWRFDVAELASFIEHRKAGTCAMD
jgi:hypothetical protein